MGKATGISWTDSTFNPWIGCTKVGPGCDHCYAEAVNIRFEKGANWGPGAPRRRMTPRYRLQPHAWNRSALARLGRRQRVFCASHADVFDIEIDQAWRNELWATIASTPNLDWQLVTKRVGNVAKQAPAQWIETRFPPNVIVIATVTAHEEFKRDWPKLNALPCSRGLSIEPQLGPISIQAAQGALDWVIVGGESHQGATARPFRLAWARSLIEQGRRYRIPIFIKQLGGRPIWDLPDDVAMLDAITDRRAGAIPAEWPFDLRVQEFPR